MTEMKEGSRSTQIRRATEMYLAGSSAAAAAKHFNVPKSALYRWLRFTNQFQSQSERYTQRSQDPSLEEIAARAAAINASWTPEERAKRWVANSRHTRMERMYAALRRHRGEAA